MREPAAAPRVVPANEGGDETGVVLLELGELGEDVHGPWQPPAKDRQHRGRLGPFPLELGPARDRLSQRNRMQCRVERGKLSRHRLLPPFAQYVVTSRLEISPGIISCSENS